MDFVTSTEKTRWRALLEGLPAHLHDVHWLPEMMSPYERIKQGKGSLLIIDDDKGYALWPLLVTENGTHHPFNFGGPLATSTFESRISYPAQATLNPFYADYQRSLLIGLSEYCKDVVWCDLTQQLEMRQTTRHCAEKAIKAGVEIAVVTPTFDNICLFANMYEHTMRLHDAADHWKFPRLWFEDLFWSLPQNTTLIFAYNDGKAEAGCILLHGFGTCYYHFSASYRVTYGAGHLMVMKAIDWARNAGNTRFHLGGGVIANDNLFTFKSGFSKLRAPVYKYRSKTKVA